MKAALLVKECWFIQPLPEYGMAYISESGWPDIDMRADRDNREIVIKSKKYGTTRVPFENVRQYKAGGLAKADE